MNKPFVPNVLHFKKSRRREKGGKEVRRVKPVIYQYAICSLEDSRIFANHLEMARKTISNFLKRNTKILIRMVPTISRTTKPHDVRRGRGKGTVDNWFSFVRKDRVILEFEAASAESATAVARIVRSKMPFKVKLLINETYDSLAASKSGKVRR